eukprot:11193847-Karenia_brevis.AAC.1
MMKNLGIVLARHSLDVKTRPHPESLLDVNMDASAGKAIARRRGAGDIRHIATPTLWIQKVVFDGIIK